MSASKQYSKDLNKLISFRVSEELQTKASQHAYYQGISFSDFMRQSILNNLHIIRSHRNQNIRTSLNSIRNLSNEKR